MFQILTGGEEMLEMDQCEFIRTAHRVEVKNITGSVRQTGHSRNRITEAIRGEPWDTRNGNTTGFERCRNSGDIEMMTDYNNEDLLIREYGCTSPVTIYDTSRAAIGYKQKQALKMLKQALRE